MASHLRAVGARQDLSLALDEQQLEVHYQPIVELRTGAVRGAEALLRWVHPAQGVLPAAQFLPAIENSPVMRQVTSFVLREACTDIATHAPPEWQVSVNITAEDASRDGLVDQVAAALEASGLPAARLVLEVTETGLLSNHEASARVLGRLRELGVRVSLDDFGTGYSSLSLLRDLPISELKVDAVFVADVDTSAADAAIVGNVLRLAEAFGADVVAEGVERIGQAQMLEQMGCEYAQGHLWSRAAPLSQVTTLGTPPRRSAGRPPQVVLERVEGLLATGASVHSVAAALNAAGLRTADGKRWHPSTVSALIRTLQAEA